MEAAELPIFVVSDGDGWVEFKKAFGTDLPDGMMTVFGCLEDAQRMVGLLVDGQGLGPHQRRYKIVRYVFDGVITM